MSGQEPQSPDDQATLIVAKSVAPSDTMDADAATVLVSRPASPDAMSDVSADEARTVVFDQANAPTLLLSDPVPSPAELDATMIMTSVPSRPSGVGSPITAVSLPQQRAPESPKATVISTPGSATAKAASPRTGASATPSSARTIGSAVERSELPEVGEIVKARFELVEELGRGGMGAVFLARDLRKVEALDPDPYVAIKFISGALIGFELAFVALQREAKNAQRLNHPNIVKVFDFDRDGPLVYLTMEVVNGEALNRRVRDQEARPLLADERQRLAHDMLAGMSYAHERDVSHADLKPSNMMVDASGDLKILDFGIARRSEYDTVFDADDLFALTIDYASPEMLDRKRPTPADDVYALGCIIYALHTGRHPFNHVRADQAKNDGMLPARPANATRVQWLALRKALAFSREQRFVDAGHFLRAYEGRDWRKVSSVASAVLVVVLGIAWVAADPIQSWMTVAGLQPEQRLTLDRSLQDGSEYLNGGYAEDALYAYAEALTLNSYSAPARSGARSALDILRGKLPPEQYREYLRLQQQDAKSPAWLRELVESELAKL